MLFYMIRSMILSMAAVKKIIESGQCRCRSDDSPDDMHLGSCMSHLSIPITHYQGFHQVHSILIHFI